MQASGWALSRLRGVSHFLHNQGLRALQISSFPSHQPSDTKIATSAGSFGEGVTHLQSVISVQEGHDTFAAATVAFDSPGEHGDNAACKVAAQHAAQVALLALRGALGSQRPPSALVAMASLDLPQSAVQALTAALVAALGPETPVVGCSSRLRLPDEVRSGAALAGARAGGGVQANGGGDGGGAGGRISATASSTSPARLPYHVTLAAAHLPYHEVHAVRSETSSLPRLPYLTEALQGRRPPAFLMLADTDSVAAELLTRLENLFPGSCIGAGVAAQTPGRHRKGLMLVGPGGTSTSGSGSGAGSAASSTSTSMTSSGTGGAAMGQVEGQSWVGTSVPAPSSPAAAAAAAGRGGFGWPYDGTASEAAERGNGGLPSDLEGPFQRMLLDRDGSSLNTMVGSSTPDGRTSDSSPAAASTSNPAAPSADGADGGGEAGGGAGRRRRPPSPAAASPTATSHSVESDDAAAAPSLDASMSPYVTVSDRVHSGGCALLAIYPKTPAAGAAAAGAAAARAAAASAVAGAAAASGGDPAASVAAAVGRLSGVACDRLSRVALGTDLLHHVGLRGAALAAISPPPTGPEPATPYPAAPDNPYYWWPAAAALPRLTVDPHLAERVGTGQILAQNPDSSRSHLNREKHNAAQAVATQSGTGGLDEERGREDCGGADGRSTVAAAGSNVGEEDKKEGDKKESEDDSDDDEAARPSAAALAALNEGLVGLPLFPLDTVVLFPGQTIQLRIFEKRYRLLIRSCLEQGAAFGLCSRGMGTTAVVRSYQCAEGGSSDIMVLLEGGVRFSYSADNLAVQPASYGINVAQRAEYVLDEPPARESDAAAMLAAAHSILDGIAGALEAVTVPSARHAARTFANALHFASSSNSTSSNAADSGTAAAATPGQRPPGSLSPGGADGSATAAVAEQAGGVAGAGAGAEGDAALLAADVAEAKRALDPDTASLLSLYLAPHIPVHLESLRREWFTTRNALWRLQQEASWLRANPRVCLAVASSVLRLPREHPLRVMLGLSSVAPVGG